MGFGILEIGDDANNRFDDMIKKNVFLQSSIFNRQNSIQAYPG